MTDDHTTSPNDRRHPSRKHMREPDFAPEDLIRVVADRLRRVCAHFPPEEFARFVQRVAHVQWKYEQRERPDSSGRHR